MTQTSAKKIMTVVGARPQFIKAAMVSKALKNYRPEIKETIIHTGQHYDNNMSDVFFSQLQIPPPDINLGVGGGSHGQNTGRMLEKIEHHLIENEPDWVLTYGDTDSTLAASLAATKLNIKVAHVEAGLRSFNMQMPEEINRILTDRVSNMLFCPTTTAIDNLTSEGIINNSDIKIVQCGDVMFDAALHYHQQKEVPNFTSKPAEKFVLVTVHRAENTDSMANLKQITSAINEIASDRDIIFPVHPRTNKVLRNANIKMHPRVHLLPPQSYFALLWLLDNASVVMTDSGGLQKEAYFFQKPCITLREQTEWVELLDTGISALAGANKNKIKTLFAKFSEQDAFQINQPDLYGKGNSAEIIAKSF